MDSNRDMSKTVTIPGELHSAATGNIVAASEEIFDYQTNSRQSDLNMDSLSYNVSKHHPEKDFYTFDEAVRLVPEEFRVGGLKLTFKSDSSSMESYFFNGTSKDEFLNEDKWGSSVGKYIDCPEYIQVTLDGDDKVIDGTKQDGTKLFKVGVETEKISISGNEQYTIKNPEYFNIMLDASDNIISGIKSDGVNFFNVGIETEKINIGGNEYYVFDSPEWLRVVTDSEGKIIAGIRNNGSTYIAELEGIDIDSIKHEIQEYIDEITQNIKELNNTFEYIDDVENRSELKIDSSSKIISCRKDDGTLVENVGIETQNIKTDSINLGYNAIKTIKDVINDSPSIRKWNIPEYGYVNFDTEDFFVTANSEISGIESLHIEHLLEDTDENAKKKVPIDAYYIGDTRLLQFAYGNCELNQEDERYYAKTNIIKINDVCYFLDTVGNGIEVIDGYSVVAPYDSELAEGETKTIQVEAQPITGPVEVNTWAVNKVDKHHIKGSIDFGNYFSRNPCYLEVKIQGASTQSYRRRNFRITFYKKSDYKKKDKIKIGELLRLSGFNLKSEWRDPSKIKELFGYRKILDIYQQRDMYDRYPWYKDNTPMCGATGTINGFNIRVSINGEFYGVYYFGLKKDEKNYMLDGDNPLSGAFVQSEGNSWVYYNPAQWSDEMNDEMPQETSDALADFFSFINGENFDREHIPERLSVYDWIDYLIILQVFTLGDNIIHNIIMYSDASMYKWYPYVYDIDMSINKGYEQMDILDVSYPGSGPINAKIFRDLITVYWDEIVNRYSELRSYVLSDESILTTIDSCDNVPQEDRTLELQKWGFNITNEISTIKEDIIKRLHWLDNNYFIQ